MMRQRRPTITTIADSKNGQQEVGGSTTMHVPNGGEDENNNSKSGRKSSIWKRVLLEMSPLRRNLLRIRQTKSSQTIRVAVFLLLLLLLLSWNTFYRVIFSNDTTTGSKNNEGTSGEGMDEGGVAFGHKNSYIKFEPIRQDNDTYDIYNCPEVPPLNYPREYPILHVLRNWNPSIVKQDDYPDFVYQGICVFDFEHSPNTNEEQEDGEEESTRKRRRLQIAKHVQNYRDAEVPFIVRNDPKVKKSVKLWNDREYLMSNLDNTKLYQATLSDSTIMTYYSMDPNYNVVPENFVPYTRNVPMTYKDWYTKALKVEREINGYTQEQWHNSDKDSISYPEPYAYLRLDACLPDQRCDSTYRGNPKLDNADFIYDILDFFQPTTTTTTDGVSNLYQINVTEARGIQCRLGVPGIVAENHFDNENNYIVMMGGSRRYLLGHPKNCPNMYLHEQKHPLERHTQIDWSRVTSDTQDLRNRFPNFHLTSINEVVLQPGDVLYLPTYWFHHIISLTTNYQCNTRSGYNVKYDQIIYDCGFFYDFPSYQDDTS